MAPLLVSVEQHEKILTLLVDRKGIFAEDIVSVLDSHITTVVVTSKQFSQAPNLIPVPFTKPIPEIPEGDYSHIFFVWDGQKESLHILEPLLQKASADKAKFLFITDYHFFNEKLLEYLHQEYAGVNVLLVGDIFGSNKYESIVTQFFYSAHKKGMIQVHGVGLHTIYPVLYEDVVKEIVHIGFSGEKKKIFLIAKQHGITELGLAHAMQRIDPLIKVDFQKEEPFVASMPEGEYVFDNSYDLQKKIQNTYADLVAGKREEGYLEKIIPKFSPQSVHKKEKNKGTKPSKVFIGFFLLLFIGFFPVFLTFFYGLLGGTLLYAAVNSAKENNFAQASSFAQAGENLFSLSKQSNDFSSQELKIILLGNFANNITEKINAGEVISSIATDGFLAAGKLSQVATGKSISPYSDFQTGVNYLKNILITLEGTSIKENISGFSLQDLSQKIIPFASVLDVASSVFGFPEKKTYAILFQNNMELRPGGGFIGSYAIVTIDKGKVGEMVIHDVYDADGQLQGHIEPPYVIRRYIPQVHWYLRDSNFDVDFSQDAKNAAFFLKQETGQQVDGVIGVDLSFVKSLLSAIGPVYVPEYKETVTADNFFLLTETHAEKNSFAGSTQKKDFLGAFLNALKTKTASIHIGNPATILPLLTAVEEKHLVFGFSDQALQDVFTVSGFSSSLWDGRHTKANEVLDFTGINEANIGINKANAFVTRQVSQIINISQEGNVSGKLTIQYKNDSVPNKWPGGPYRNYLRVILPQGTSIQSISIDGVNQKIIPAITDAAIYEKKGFVAPSGLEVDSTKESGKQIFGFLIDIPVQASQEIDVTYILPQKLDMTQPIIGYDGLLFKQPGVDSFPYSFLLTVPSSFSVLQKPKEMSTTSNGASFSKQFTQDTSFSVVFSKK